MSVMAYRSAVYCSALLQRLKEMYDRGELCDFSLIADDAEVKLHSVVLFGASSFFKALMNHGAMKEQQFRLQGSNLESLEILVDFMYTGCLMLSEKNIFGTLALATQLNIPEATELCQQFLQDITRGKQADSLDSISSFLKANSEPMLGLTIKQELDELDNCDGYRQCTDFSGSEYEAPMSKNCTIKKRTINPKNLLLCRQRNEDGAGDHSEEWRIMNSLQIDMNRKKKRPRTRKSLCQDEEEQTCHVCRVCKRRFRRWSGMALHQQSHWSVIYRKLTINHLIELSKENCTSTGADRRECLLCNEAFQCACKLRAHQLVIHIGQAHRYRCRRCSGKSYMYKKHLLIHSLVHHSSACRRNLLKCPSCRRRFLHKRSLLLHRASSHRSPPERRGAFVRRRRGRPPRVVNNHADPAARWRCEEKNCSSTFALKSKLIEHMVSVHPDVNYSCPINKCKFSTKVKMMLDRHCKRFHDASCNNICDVCGKMFQRAFRLKIHLFSRHRIKDPDLTVYRCPEEGCHYSTVLKDGVKKHMRKHQPEKPFTCEICGKRFKTHRSVEKHTAKVHLGIRNYICDICGVSYGDESELKIHMVRHSDTKTYRCEHCHYATFDKGNYKTHLYGKHGVKLEEDMKIFECSICQFTTSIKYQYSDHMRVHYQIRDIPCPHCSKKFITRKSMRSHVVKCHKPKDYHCTVCSYSSADKSKVREHIRVIHTHRHYKPYKCPYCSFQCATGGNCRKHVKQRHKGEEVRYIKLPLADPLSALANPQCYEAGHVDDGQPMRMADPSRPPDGQRQLPPLIALQAHGDVPEYGDGQAEPAHEMAPLAQNHAADILPLSLHQTLGDEVLEPRMQEASSVFQTLNITGTTAYDLQPVAWPGFSTIMQQQHTNI